MKGYIAAIGLSLVLLSCRQRSPCAANIAYYTQEKGISHWELQDPFSGATYNSHTLSTNTPEGSMELTYKDMNGDRFYDVGDSLVLNHYTSKGLQSAQLSHPRDALDIRVLRMLCTLIEEKEQKETQRLTSF